MKNNVRPTVPNGFRMPLALTAAALMVTGSAAMAWPVFKSAFGPSITSQASVAPSDPAAVSGFVNGTRAQMVAVPAVADSSDMTDPVLVRIPSLMLDRDALRQPRSVQDTLPGPEIVAPVQPVQQPQTQPDPQPEVSIAQAQTPRPVSRPIDQGDMTAGQAGSAQVATPQPMITDRNTASDVMPVTTRQVRPSSNPSSSSSSRLNGVWMTGAFR